MSSLSTCPRCGAGLSDQERVEGLCAGCLLVAGLDSKHGDEAEVAARRPAPPVEELAPHFADLEILELVGQGGMGAVYRVRQKKLGREAALKVLALDAEASPAFGERFEREARTLAALDHENIVHVYDSGRAGPWWYLLMEFVDGVSLRQMIRAREVDARTALGIVAQVCDALQCAHDHGVVHRDIKPENVLVDRRGRVKILDFGLAKLLGREPRTGTLTETGQVMGTPRYMAPEQWERPLAVDHRADIYSVGVVFYELLTGELPIGAFALPSQKGVADHRVDPVVMKTLAKEPERRYQHASEVRTEVNRIQGTPPPLQTVSSAGSADVLKKSDLRRTMWIAFGCAGCATVLLVPVLLFAFLGARLDQAEEANQAVRAESERARELALSAPRFEGRAVRAETIHRAGPAPRVDRERARALGWTPRQIDHADAMLDLTWQLNVARAIPELIESSDDAHTVKFRIDVDPRVLEAHTQLIEAVLRGGSVGLSYDGSATSSGDATAPLSGYSFSGSGYSVVVDATGILTWWAHLGELRSGEVNHHAGLLPRGASPATVRELAGTDAWPNFDAEPWIVTVVSGEVPSATVELSGVLRTLSAEELRGKHRLLLDFARSVSESSPR